MSAGLSKTQLRHPLASTKRLLKFVDKTKFAEDEKKVEYIQPFEVLTQYDTEYAIAKGTYGFVARARDREKAAEYARSHDEQNEADYYDKLTLVAIKKGSQLFEHGNPRVWLCAIREIQLLFSFEHPNVMCATDLFIPLGEVKDLRLDLIQQRQRDFEEIYIVMPFMNYSLRDLLTDSDDQYLVYGVDPISGFMSKWHAIGSGLRRHLLYHITCGLGYIHLCGVMHRDLKPENILLIQDEAMPKICDFGQGREISREQSITRTNTDNCTQWYACPESLTLDQGSESEINRDTLHSADAWSLGCIAAELLLGKPLFETDLSGGKAQLKTIMAVLGQLSEETYSSLVGSRSDKDKTEYKKIIDSTHAKIPPTSVLDTMLHAAYDRLHEEVDQNEIDLITGLLQYDPSQRWTCERALNSPHFPKNDYDAVIGGVVKDIKLVDKEDVATAQQGREYLWKLFVEKHPTVTQLLSVLSNTVS